MRTRNVIFRLLGIIALVMSMLGIFLFPVSVGLFAIGLVFLFEDMITAKWLIFVLVGLIVFATTFAVEIIFGFRDTFGNWAIFIGVLVVSLFSVFGPLVINRNTPTTARVTA